MKIELMEKKEIARNTFSLYFSKSSSFVFIPGQYVEMSVELKYDDKKGGKRYFSIASGIHEDFLMFAFRNTGSGFKKTLLEMDEGDSVEISNAMGNFILDKTKKCVFVAGGIGITPFRSMIVSYPDFMDEITLFYANRTLEDAAFFDELSKMVKNFFPAFSDKKENGYYYGRLDAETILNNSNKDAAFYIAGTPGFVFSLENQLREKGVKDIRTDDFSGY